MSWYKLSYDVEFNLAKTISTWLQQAYYGPVDINQVNNDVDMIAPQINDSNAINNAVAVAESQARSALNQSGDLNDYQQDLVNKIKYRLFNSQFTGFKNQTNQQNQTPNIQNEEGGLDNTPSDNVDIQPQN